MNKKYHPTTAQKVFEMKNITKKFGDFIANDNINLTVHERRDQYMLFRRKWKGKPPLMNIL